MRKILWIVSLLGLLVTATALADPKRINGAMCELERDEQIVDIDRGAIRLGAHHGAEVGVVCPLLRSNTTNTTGLLNLVVNLYKAKTTTFTCYGESYDQNGSALKIVSRSTNATGRIGLTWNGSINTSSSKGTYGVICYEVGASDDSWADEIFAIDYDEP